MIDLLDAYRADFDTFDVWGSNINKLFDISAELWMRNEGPPWEYSPGLAADPREDSIFAGACKNATTEELLAFGALLNTFDDAYRQNDLNY